MKTIRFAVGSGGTNEENDIRTVQYLLNCVPLREGGPAIPIMIDGSLAFGPNSVLTQAAIGAVQLKWFGRSDGRVDPNGSTLRKLQSFDPTPNGSIVPSGKKGGGMKGSGKKGSSTGPPTAKKISGMVGQGGSNLRDDVRTIKYLLNNVPPSRGGPDSPLFEDDSLSTLIRAISRFQSRTFTFSDGRVDPRGRTLQELNQFDPTPGDPPIVPNTRSGKKGGGKKGRP